MTFKTRELTVDLINEVSTNEIRFSQGDKNSAKLVLNITNEGQELDLSQATAVRITFEKQDGKIIFQQDCQPINAMKGKYQIVLKTQTLAVIGNVLGQVTIFEDDDREIDSQMFVFTVKRSLSGDDTIESTNDFTIIQKALELGDRFKDFEEEDFDALIKSKEIAEQAKAAAAQNANQIGILSGNVSTNTTQLGNKADKTYVDSELMKKAAQSDLITKADKTYVDTKVSSVASGSPKGTYATLADLQTAKPTGDSNIYVVTADGKWYYWNGSSWVSGGIYQSSGISDKSIGTTKLNFRYLSGIIKQGSININTTSNKLECKNGGVMVDNLSSYIVYSTHEVNLGINDDIKCIYFNTVSKLFEVYAFSTVPNNPDIAFIATYYQGVFNSLQDAGSLLFNGEIPKFLGEIGYENVKMPFLTAYAVNGDIKIDTIAKTITFATFNMLTLSGRQKIVPKGTVSWTSISSNTAVNIYWNYDTNSFVFYTYDDSLQRNKKLFFFGTIFENKLHGALSNKFVSVNGIADGGWYVAPTIDNSKNRITTLNEIWNNWENGLKSPIGFLGDSTADGDTTSHQIRNVIGTDYINPYSYSYLLEQLVRQETTNELVRIYNAGFSGKTASWAKDNINQIFGAGTPYSDVKMVGISYGINDSLTSDVKAYYTNFKSNVEWLINYFKGKNIQPFLVTTQATLTKSGGNTQTKSVQINTVANKVKQELANKYNLELIDINQYTEMFMMHSKHELHLIEPDVLHFGDVGHNYESGLYFSKICPRVLSSSQYNKIGMITQNIKTNLLNNQITKSTTSPFKFTVDFTRSETTDIKIFDCLLFNDEKTQLRLNVTGDVIVKINNQVIDPDTYELDLGLHRIEIISRKTRVYFEGVNLVRV